MAERNRQMKLSKLHKEAATTKMIAKLDELAAKRNVWQAEHDRTNVGLYNLLASCLESYYEIKGTTAEKEILTGSYPKAVVRVFFVWRLGCIEKRAQRMHAEQMCTPGFFLSIQCQKMN